MWSWDFSYDLAQVLQPLGRAHPYCSCRILRIILELVTRAGHETSGLRNKSSGRVVDHSKIRTQDFPQHWVFFVLVCSLGPESVLMPMQEELAQVWLFWSCLPCDFQNIGVWIPNIIQLYKHYSPFLWITILHFQSELLYTWPYLLIPWLLQQISLKSLNWKSTLRTQITSIQFHCRITCNY